MPPQPSIHFLLVEDDEDHAELIRRSFEAHRVLNTIDHVPTGEEALALVRGEGQHEARPRPDVVLLDLDLPGMSGLDVLEAMKKDPDLRSIPVVALTTSNSERDREAAYERRANSYVTKPVDFQLLQGLVEDLQMYWVIHGQPPV